MPVSTKSSSTPVAAPSGRTSLPNAFTPGFLLKGGLPEGSVGYPPAALGRGSRWLGPWEVEAIEVNGGRGVFWAVVRRGERVADGGAAVAVLLERPTAHLTAASLPSLAIPNHLSVGVKAKRLGS